MTGLDNHIVGLANVAELLADNQRGKPGYEGRPRSSGPESVIGISPES